MPRITLIIALLTVFLSGCLSSNPSPDLGKLYNDLAQNEDPYRNPVIVMPGILGSRLVEPQSGTVVWGAFGFGQVNPHNPAGARMVALPMSVGKKLSQLRDPVVSDGALDRIIVNLFGYPMMLKAYYNILRVLGIGGYRDETLAEADAVHYGDRHFTCFQFDYDWRRDIVESAKALHRFILEKRRYVQGEIEKRFGIKDVNVRFDIVSHSMGGLVARYYLRYGASDLPADGSPPTITWAGSRHIDYLVMIAPPNGGSLNAFLKLVKGFAPAPLFPHYPAAIVGTMPSLYELLPRSRNQPIFDNQGRPVKDIFDPELWRRNGWGLADPRQAGVLKMLLPHVGSPERRRQIALDHLQKALARARQFVAALDVPAKSPPSAHLVLVAGDVVDTNKAVRFDREGRLTTVEKGPGDGIVLRSSALMDERPSGDRTKRLVSPIKWSQVFFLPLGHLGITKDPAFIDNLLYILLESPRGP